MSLDTTVMEKGSKLEEIRKADLAVAAHAARPRSASPWHMGGTAREREQNKAASSSKNLKTALRLFVGIRFQGLFHSPCRGAFHLSLTVLVRYRSCTST